MAIDPPYRLDPFQNIINVSWKEHTDYIQSIQYFVFCRNYPINCFYPVSEEFVQQQLDEHKTNIESLEEISGFAVEQKLSDLINGAMSLSTETPPNEPYESWASSWVRISTGVAAYWEWTQPNNSNPFGYYHNNPANGTYQYVYIFKAGYYYEDDMNTDDWPPEFVPV